MLVNYEIEAFDDEAPDVFDYTGEYEDFADTAQPYIVEGTVKVYCPEGHDWRTAVVTGPEQPKPTLPAIETLTAHKMAVRWSHHKQAWVATMLRADNGREVQFVAPTPAGAIEGAHAKATAVKVAR